MNCRTGPLVSIIIPCYNVAGFVEKAINSILSQTYYELEIWIIDDGSTDDTLEKIKAFKDDRIKVVSFKKNTKKVGAVNEVLKKVNGQYIAFQDADDWSEPERIEVQLKEFTKDAALGICFTNYRYVGKKTIASCKIALTNEELRNEFLHYTYKRQPGTAPTICATMMISKASLDKTGGYNPYFAGRVAEDIQWIYRILKEFKGITIDKVLYNYSVRAGSLTEISSTGRNVKSSYSVQLLSKIIKKDIQEGIDILSPENASELKLLELEACEDALAESIHALNETKALYKGSMSFKLGQFILRPLQLLKRR
ncbi:glycosyltransferase family 2 protein [Ginsengibacter hankyongi]|uniref:Glycosyltransferase family 2 protein n=1 Tax=Ginsengibacter hankyongi TaxID=2607284 RepID=A0A5J5ID94_9BACT|nr:glycosyltransferase family 2 protein [Ginsengibacter hankyongi]KAA9036393.1 glycosyltransferase family 2 protein [Ginsengibacter hankyongi]